MRKLQVHIPHPSNLFFTLAILFFSVSNLNAQELREVALEKGIKFGSPLFNLYDLGYQQLFIDQINIGTIPAYWKYTTHNQEGSYTWGDMDAAIAFGEQNGWELHGHPLVWGSDVHIPDWVKNKPTSDGEAIMIDHIRTVAGRYGNRIKTWDVVNEAIEDDGTYRDCYWNRSMTGEFIAKAFIEAKAVVPNAVLLYNDYGIESNPAKFNTVKSMLGWIQTLGAQVDGLGWQVHTDVNTVLDPNFQLEQYMMEISNMGLKNYVTELDIRMPSNTPAERERQKLAYRKIAEIFLCNPTKGDYFQTWDISDKHTWWNNFQPQNAPFYPLPFDENFNKKPAYWGMVDAFSSAACDEVCKIPSPPVLDGSSIEWGQTAYSLENNVQGTPNASDLSADFQLTWDNNYLYVFGSITDDVLTNDSGINAWEDDGFEIYLDGGNDRSFTYDGNDHQLMFRVNDPTVLYWSTQQTNPAGVDFSRVITNQGYDIEVRIAWSFIGVSPFSGMDLGIDIHVNDDDDGGVRDHKLAWFAREDQAWNNASLFNTIQLSDNQCVNTTRLVTCAPSLYLEGPYFPTTGLMTTNLLQIGLLPAGQPYAVAPWNYPGLEGAGWGSSDYPAGAVDWVLVSLRTSPSSGDEIARFAAVLLEDGTTSALSAVEVSPVITAAYVVVEHRNHLPAMSATPVDIINNTISYDFRNQNSYTGASGSGFGQKQIGGKWALYMGNADQTNPLGYEITGADRVLWQVQNGNFGIYESTDFNFDGDVSGNDRVLWSINNGISSSIPR